MTAEGTAAKYELKTNLLDVTQAPLAEFAKRDDSVLAECLGRVFREAMNSESALAGFSNSIDLPEADPSEADPPEA